MKRSVPVLLALLPLACAPLSPDGEVRIRVANDSDVEFEEVVVGFPSGFERFGALAPGAFTRYAVVETAYRYAYFEVHLAEDTLVLQPIDYVGEAPLRGGRYTYALDVGSGPGQLLYRLIDDE